ncbi:MAG: hypothetical protein R3F42_02715 [Pseudomonadota bacterium]
MAHSAAVLVPLVVCGVSVPADAGLAAVFALILLAGIWELSRLVPLVAIPHACFTPWRSP